MCILNLVRDISLYENIFMHENITQKLVELIGIFAWWERERDLKGEKERQLIIIIAGRPAD